MNNSNLLDPIWNTYQIAKDWLKVAQRSVLIVDANLLGNAKQVKNYRDWVAHKNVKKGQPTNVSPQAAYRILTRILEKIEKI